MDGARALDDAQTKRAPSAGRVRTSIPRVGWGSSALGLQPHTYPGAARTVGGESEADLSAVSGRGPGGATQGQAPAERVSRVVREPIKEPDRRWGLDWVSDTLITGRTFHYFTVVDDYSRESPVVEVDFSLPANRVIEVLERLHVERGLPDMMVTDHGSEFTSRAFDAWAYARGVEIN